MAKQRQVVAVLEYDGERHHASGTFSFADRQSDMRVLIAQAEQVPGVRYANDGLGDGTQELEIRITAHHAETLAGAKKVMDEVARRLGLTLKSEMRIEKERRHGRGDKRPVRSGATNSLRVSSPTLHGKSKR